MAALAPHLPPTLTAGALTTAAEILDERARADALAALAPHLPTTLLSDALTTAAAMDDEHWKARAIAALAPYLPAALADQALQDAANLQDDGDRGLALESLAALEAESSSEADSSSAPVRHRWTGAMWMLANHRRPNLLVDLCALAPMIAKSGGQAAVSQAVAAIEDVGRWWP